MPLKMPAIGKKLSKRETETLAGICRGLSCKEIAAELGISSKTVDTHRGHLIDKTGMTSNVLLFNWALEQGLVKTINGYTALLCSEPVVAHDHFSRQNELSSYEGGCLLSEGNCKAANCLTHGQLFP